MILRGRAFHLLISFSSCEFPREEGHQPKLLDTQATKFFKVAIFSSHSDLDDGTPTAILVSSSKVCTYNQSDAALITILSIGITF